MNKKHFSRIIFTPLLLLLAACTTKEMMAVPNTQPGDQLEPGYLVGKWCDNRELTSTANSKAGHSALLNLENKFWKFKESGRWEDSGTGWMYANFGEWQLQGRDRLVLNPLRGNPSSYQASFRNSGVDLILQDQAGQFMVLTRCD